MRTRIHQLMLTLTVWSLTVTPVFAAPRIPNDPFFPQQWYLEHVNVTEAWNQSLGFEGVIVAVIDSGVDIDHPDLKDNIWRNVREIAGDGLDNDGNGYIDDVHGWDFVSNDGNPTPDASNADQVVGISHGTISAGIIAARGDNNEGVTGVSWQSTIMPIRALDSNGEGDPLDVVRAVRYAVDNGAKIINMSFAGTIYHDSLRAALRDAYDRGVFIVAAAGNAPTNAAATDLDRTRLYPVCLDADDAENFIYGVAALDDTDTKAGFSNYGVGCVDGAAPGTRVITTQYHDATGTVFNEAYGGYFNGTSIAAPIIAGVASLMKAVNPQLTPKQITNMLTQSSVDVNSLNPDFFGKLGRGRVEAAEAVKLAAQVRTNAPAPVASTTSLLPPGASGDLLVTAPGSGRDAEVRIFTNDGLFIRSFHAYPTGFRGGVSMAIAQFSGNSRQTIVTGAGQGGSPQVRIFNINTQAIGGFYAYDANFHGGVNVAVGDVTGDTEDEIVTGAGPGGGPHVRIFDPQGNVLGGFFPFDENFRGGVSVAVGDVDGDGTTEILAASGAGRMTTVRIHAKDGSILGELHPFGPGHTAGATVSARDIDRDGTAEIIVRSMNADDDLKVMNMEGFEIAALDPIEDDSLGDDINIKGMPFIVGGLAGELPLVTPYTVNGNIPNRFYAYEPGFRGGLSATFVHLGN